MFDFGPANSLLLAVATLVNDYWTEAVIVITVAGMWYYRREPRRALTLALSVSLAIAVTALLKDAYAIARPCLATAALIPCPPTYSFPSNHAASAFAFVASFMGRRPFYILFPLMLLVVFTRLWLGVHTLTDVLAGTVIGIVSYFVAKEIIDRLAGHRVG